MSVGSAASAAWAVVAARAGDKLPAVAACPASCSTALVSAVGHACRLTNCCGSGWLAVACWSKAVTKACSCGLTPAAGQLAGKVALPDWMWLTKLATSWLKASILTACCAWGDRFTLLDSAACVAATICATCAALAVPLAGATGVVGVAALAGGVGLVAGVLASPLLAERVLLGGAGTCP